VNTLYIGLFSISAAGKDQHANGLQTMDKNQSKSLGMINS